MSSSALHRPPFRLNPLVRGLAFALALGSGALTVAPAHGVASPVERPWVPLADASAGPPTRTVAHPPRDPRTMHSAAPPELPTGSIPVTNCDDSGPGSLRDAVLSAASGQTIDLTNTGCSLITLTTGAIGIGQAALTLQGPTSDFLEISGNNNYQVLFHSGAGTLVIDHLALAAGRKYQTDAQVSAARGGCVFSAGTLYVSNSQVKYCEAEDTSATYGVKGGALYATSGIALSYSSVYANQAYSTASYARGGAAYTPGTLSLDHSVISGNEVKSLATNARATGGGIEATGAMLVKYSTLDSNTAYGPNFASLGGGIYGVGASTTENTTVSNNSAEEAGGILLASASPSTELTILSSTISGNSAAVHAGVCMFFNPNARIANSTIAFNHATQGSAVAAGLHLNASPTSIMLTLQSTIVSNNFSPSGDLDLTQSANSGAAITLDDTSAANLVRIPGAGALPADTLSGQCPLLRPLRNNGGWTATHALASRSIAIDNGTNPLDDKQDQRGKAGDAALYPRVSNGVADIGAFEVNQADTVFAAGFEGCAQID